MTEKEHYALHNIKRIIETAWRKHVKNHMTHCKNADLGLNKNRQQPDFDSRTKTKQASIIRYLPVNESG